MKDFYMIRFDESEAGTYYDREKALDAFEELGGDVTVLLISGDGTWSDETMDFDEELTRRDPEAAECYRADTANKMAREMA